MIVLFILKYLEKLKFRCICGFFDYLCGWGVFPFFFLVVLFFLHKALIKFDNHRCIGDE